ncbi:MAG: hypothetical protein DLM69_08875, partial [Candidatus Chloroheliales bacterium]
MRKMRLYLPIVAVAGLIVVVASLALGSGNRGSNVISMTSSVPSGGPAYSYNSSSARGSSLSAVAAPTAAMMMPQAAPAGVGGSSSAGRGPALSAGGLGYIAPSDGAAGMPAALASTPAAPNPSDRPANGGNGQPLQPAQDQNPLRASEVDDNGNYAAFLSYLNGYVGPRSFAPDLAERYFVQALNSQQRPVADATVQISSNGQTLFSGRTTSDGRVVFFPRAVQGAGRAQKLDITVSRDQASATASLVRGSGSDTASVTLAIAPDPQVNLDVVFLIDSTGSMDDEIAKIKSSVHNIAARISQVPSAPHLRLALVTYRDRGADNQYVTRKWDFTSDVNVFAQELDTLVAYNGGDYPEDINAGLLDTINLAGWSQSNGHNLRLAFLVGDAPPHLDYADEQQYPALSLMAASRGIKIFPIAASGLSDEGEFIFRQMAAMTLGKFVFLTYAPMPDGAPANSGNPGNTTTMHVAGYQTNNFDDVVVKLVSEEVANQTAPKVGQAGGGANLVGINPLPPMPLTNAQPTSPWSSLLPWLLALGW